MSPIISNNATECNGTKVLPYRLRGLVDARCTLRFSPSTPRRTYSEAPRRLRVRHGEAKANALIVYVVTHSEYIAND